MTRDDTPAAATAAGSASPGRLRLLLRLLTPAAFVSVAGLLRWRARISHRAEVELTPNLELGPGTTVSSFVKIKSSDGALRTGRDCGFASGCFIASGAGGVLLGDDVLCGPNVVIVASNYRYSALAVPFSQQGTTSLGIRIGNNVWIGANCTIADGAELGDNSIVVANSLVNRKFPANVIVQGIPARVVLQRGAT